MQRWIDDGYFTDEAYFENEFGKNVASGKRLTNRPQNITETRKKCKIQMCYVQLEFQVSDTQYGESLQVLHVRRFISFGIFFTKGFTSLCYVGN